jgi:hypothetical protein
MREMCVIVVRGLLLLSPYGCLVDWTMMFDEAPAAVRSMTTISKTNYTNDHAAHRIDSAAALAENYLQIMIVNAIA